jgi:SAM-dependent methyltransferase
MAAGERSSTVDWQERNSIRVRPYDSYESYVEHQVSKLKTLDLTNYHRKLRHVLYHRIVDIPAVQPGKSVLCIGARSGAECEAFIKRRCFAVGIDLNPGKKNRFVMHGDFHDLQFGNASVDIVYTNVFDHALDFGKMVAEMRRVLKPDGILIAEIVRGLKDVGAMEPGAWDCSWWETSEAPIAQIGAGGFPLMMRRPITAPWPGDQCVFAKAAPVLAKAARRRR